MLTKTLAIAIRALRADVRKAQLHVMRFLLCLVILLMLAIAQDSSRLQAPGRQFFQWIMFTNAVFATLGVPMLLAGAITEEKEERMLGLLKIANVSPLSLLLGKLLPRLAAVLLVMVVQFPFTLLAITLGGVTFAQILAGYTAIAAFILAVGTLSLFCSLPFQISGNATGVAALAVLGYLLGPLALVRWSLNALDDPIVGSAATMLHDLMLPVLESNVFRRLMIVSGPGFSGSPICLQVVSNLLASAVFFVLAWMSFDFFNREIEAAPARRRTAPGGGRARRRPWSAAISWKEFYFSAGGTTFLAAKIVFYALAGCLIAAAMAQWKWNNVQWDETADFLAKITFYGLIPVEITLVVARLMHEEIREKTLGSLILLPISTRQLVYRKFLGGLLALIPAVGYLLLAIAVHPDMLISLSRLRPNNLENACLTLAFPVTQLCLFWHLLFLFSLRINPGFALLAALILQYAACLIVIGVSGYVIFKLRIPWGARASLNAGWTATVATLLAVVILHKVALRQIERTAAAD